MKKLDGQQEINADRRGDGKKTNPVAWPSLPPGSALLGAGVLFFGGGCFLGARMMMKREKFIFGFRSEYVGLASRAFMYGTALSVTTVGVGTALFMQASNIHHPRELGRVLKAEFSKIDALTPEDDIAHDIDEKNKMSYDEEMSYWDKIFFAPRTAEEKDLNDAVQKDLDSKIMQKEDKLSFWDRHFNKSVDRNEKRQSLWQKWTSDIENEEMKTIELSKGKILENISKELESDNKIQNDEAVIIPFVSTESLEEKERISYWEKYFGKRKV